MIYFTIQARTQSIRFPNKILKELYSGLSVLECMIERIKIAKSKMEFCSKIVVLTTDNNKDQEIVNLCEKNNIEYFIGDEHNVFKRMRDFCKTIKTNDTIVDLTSDCPLICPVMLSKMISTFIKAGLDYYSNVITRTMPDGFDIQIYRKFLIDRVIVQNYGIQHTGWNIINSLTEDVAARNYFASGRFFAPDLGLTLDEPNDLEVIRNVFNHFGSLNFTAEQIMVLYLTNPSVFSANKDVKRKTPGV